MVIPGLYGYVSATKWVTDIKVTTFAAEHAYWTVRGWSQRAPIKTESRIDVPNSAVKAGRTAGGRAWPGPSTRASTRCTSGWTGGRGSRPGWPRCPASTRGGSGSGNGTPRRGTHIIEARATDATGYTQTSLQEPPEPNGRGSRRLISEHRRFRTAGAADAARYSSWSRIWPDR